MKRTISVVLSLALICFLFAALAGCGQDIKAENEKLKAENDNPEIGRRQNEGRNPEDEGRSPEGG